MLTDGTSDRSLSHLIEWSIWEAGVSADLVTEWADLRLLRQQPKGLIDRLPIALELYPCNLLFVHRDAENEDPQIRVDEISHAVKSCPNVPPHVAVIPVRMQESWLLCDENAIRKAAGNPNGANILNMPALQAIETLSDPKEYLFDLLKQASELSGRRLHKFNVESARTRVARYITNPSMLRQLTSFVLFEKRLKETVQAHRLDKWK